MSSMNYVFHKELNIIELTPVGEVNIRDITSYGNELIQKDLIQVGVIEYVDMSNMTNLIIDYDSNQGRLMPKPSSCYEIRTRESWC